MQKCMLMILITLTLASYTPACTSAVISGKASNDGRPLLWKHRDTGAVANKLVFGKGVRFDFVGVANRADTLSEQIWMGSNEAGFSIMNTASYNLNEGQVCDAPDDQEGLFMRTVLERCADLNDFETYMDSTSGRWGLAANFGVIDAKGGAAYYEKGYFDYTKYDVNDPAVAPDGYLIRTNFSLSGSEDKGYGYIRYDVTTQLFKDESDISVGFILKQATRNLRHGLLETDLRNGSIPLDKNDTRYVLFQDYVVRHSSASTLLIQGVKPDENPALTTLWTVLGWQPVTLVTPVWVRSLDLLPRMVQSEHGSPAPLNAAALKLKQECFPINKGNGQDYLLHGRLTNQSGEGIMDLVLPAEDEIIERAMKMQDKWRKKSPREKDLRKFNTWLETYIRTFYQQNFDLTIPD